MYQRICDLSTVSIIYSSTYLLSFSCHLMELTLWPNSSLIQDCPFKFSLVLIYSFSGLDVGPVVPRLCIVPYKTLDMPPFLLTSPLQIYFLFPTTTTLGRLAMILVLLRETAPSEAPAKRGVSNHSRGRGNHGVYQVTSLPSVHWELPALGASRQTGGVAQQVLHFCRLPGFQWAITESLTW